MSIFIILAAAIIPIVVLKLYFVLSHTDCKSKVCLVGKTALVTGGNAGIGYQIVLGLAQRGCRVIIADKTRDQNLLDNIFKETRSGNVVFKYVDLASFKSVRELARDIARDEERLDILINNAGIANVFQVTEDGCDEILQVNYLSAFLLTHLVLDLMKKTGGRIIFTGSILSHIHDCSVENLRKLYKFKDYNFHYRNSKFCCIAAAGVFAEKLEKYGITSNSYHPGLVYTNIFRTVDSGSIILRLGTKYFKWLCFLVGKKAEEGAQTAIHLACANDVQYITGEFFYETKVTFRPRLSRDKKLVQAIWEATEQMVRLEQDEKL
ncbi:retinol dehydrogenase 13-like [Anoplophora glabripennis]|uniref:retinol dehydrogenase 13-like n=1 Tax=Anoplophora glabripennis TaxID=217634 RepID=UPI0008746597|nr:retinol dehydrogenase 13-like [Anoplophora glabripennis]